MLFSILGAFSLRFYTLYTSINFFKVFLRKLFIFHKEFDIIIVQRIKASFVYPGRAPPFLCKQQERAANAAWYQV